MLSEQEQDVLRRVGSSTLYEAQGKRGALPHDIRPLPHSGFLAGIARTVRSLPADNLALHHAVLRSQPGDVLVVDCGGFLEAGVWGEILTVAAIEKGIAGLVVDGSVRDIDRIGELGFPVYSRGISMKGTSKDDPGTHDSRLQWEGTDIETGDIVVGDSDGVVVIKGFEFDTVIQAALERESSEQEMLDKLRAGSSTVELLGLKKLVEKK